MDQRRFRRVEIRLKVQASGIGEPFEVSTQNVGRGGALILAPVEPSAGDAWTIEMDLEDGGPALRLEALAVWKKRHPLKAAWHVGMRFVKLPREARDRLKTALDGHQRRFLSFLEGLPAFQAFTEEDRVRLSAFCFRHFLLKGDLFYREGEVADAMFIIEHGTVRIYRVLPSREEKLLAVASTGEIFGEVSLITRRPHGANVRALVDTRLIGISGAAYDFLKWRYPRVAIKLMDVLLSFLTRRLEQTTKRLITPIRLEEKPKR